MTRRTLVNALVALLLSAVGSYLARLSVIPFALAVVLTVAATVGGSWLIHALRKGSRLMENRLDAIEEQVRTLETSFCEIGAISHIHDIKEVTAELVREHETVIAATRTGRDQTTLTQKLTRACPGPPVDEFVVTIGMDKGGVGFKELKYEILTKETAEITDHEKIIVRKPPNPYTRFIVHHRLLKPLTYGGPPVEVISRYSGPFTDPVEDFAGLRSGPSTSQLKITVWFPSDNWVVEDIGAFRGTPLDDEVPETVHPNVEVQAMKGKMRTCAFWEKAQPDPDSTYFIRWKAHKKD